MEIKFVQNRNDPKPTGALGFGKYYTDYMLMADWSTEKAGTTHRLFRTVH